MTAKTSNCWISYGGGLGTSPCIMGLTTQGPYIQKEHTELYKILKFRVNWANIEQDTAIQNTSKFAKKCMDFRTSVPQSIRILQPYNIRVAHKPTTTLRNLLTNVKDRDEPNNRQGAVYKIKCSDCQASYIGETGRNLNTRLTEHKRATRNGDVNNYIAVHHQLTNHNIDWDTARCLTYSRYELFSVY